MQQAAGICDYHKKKYKINCLLRLQHVEQLVELSREKKYQKTENKKSKQAHRNREEEFLEGTMCLEYL